MTEQVTVVVFYFFVREDIIVKHLSTEAKPIEAFFVELIFARINGYYAVLTIQISQY